MSGLVYSCPECQYSLKAQPHADPPGMYDCPKCNIIWMIVNFSDISRDAAEGLASHYSKNPIPEKTKEAFRRSVK